MKKWLILSLITGCAFAKTVDPITVLRVPEAKYNAHARLKITSPKVLKKDTPVLVLVSNFPIGVDVDSQTLDSKGVTKSKHGSRVLLLFSNGRRIYVTKEDVNLLLTQRSYFNKRFRIKIPTDLYQSIEGDNFIMYSLLVNAYGESIKKQDAFYTDVYCYKHERGGMRATQKQLEAPFIVYNEPFGQVSGSGILLDFYVRNCIISPTEYKVDVYVDNHKVARVSNWNPYVIENLKKGKHDIRLELIDPTGKIVKNPVSVNESTIYYK